MNVISSSLIVAVIQVVFAQFLYAGTATHWDYSKTGHSGPEHWGELDQKFIMCSLGKNQSPINLTGVVDANLHYLDVNYKAAGNEVINNGHTIQINYGEGSYITVNEHRFELKQFHFHTPSENTIDGKSWPLEAHFVHLDKDGNIAVIALMFRTGQENEELQKAWSKMPEKPGEKNQLTSAVDAAKLLPEDLDYYRFNGSLTTPPCSEGVLWMVLRKDVKVSNEQFSRFADVMHHPNNRPIQPVNSRLILK